MYINYEQDGALSVKTYTGKLLESDRLSLINNEMFLEEHSGFWHLLHKSYYYRNFSIAILSYNEIPLALATIGDIFQETNEFSVLYDNNTERFYMDLGYMSVFVKEEYRGKNLSKYAIKHLVKEFNDYVETWPKVLNKDNTIYFVESQNPKMKELCLAEKPKKLVVYNWDGIDIYSKNNKEFVDALGRLYSAQERI